MSRSVTAFGMNRVDFIDREEMQKPVDKAGVTVERGDEGAYVVVVDDVGTDIVVFVHIVGIMR